MIKAIALFVFAAAVALPVCARADICSEVVTAHGSGVDRNSAVYDRSGLRLPIKLGFFCRFKPSQINVRFWVHDRSGKLYNVREMWYEAASLRALPNVKTTQERSAPPARTVVPGDAWANILRPEYNAMSQLSSNSGKCAAASVACLRLTQALQAAETQTDPRPQQIAFTIGEVPRGSTMPATGAVMESSVVAAPRTAKTGTTLSEVASLTLYVQHRPYTVATLHQQVTLSTPLQYKMGARIGSNVPATRRNRGYYNFQTFSGEYEGDTLSFQQANTQGRDFDFCPPVTLTFRTPALPVQAVMHCTGHADMGYDVQATPTVGYFRLQPNVQLTMQGQLLLNGTIAVGTVEGDLTLANFAGSTGGMYGFFDDAHAGPMLAYRHFAYYDANAFHFTVTASLHTTWGADPGSKTLYSFSGRPRSLSPDPNRWYVMHVRPVVY